MTAREHSPPGAAAVVVAGLLALCLPVGTAAQQGCALGEGSAEAQREPDPRDRSLSITRLRTPHFECTDGVEIWADSTVAYQYDQMAILYGSVRYVDRQRELRADNARYFTAVGRLQAQGNVFVTNYEDGSTVANGDLVYLRQTDTRTIEEMTFTTGSDGLRPRATVYPRRAEPTDSAEAALAEEPDSADAPGADSAAAAPDSAATPVMSDSLAAPPDSAAAPTEPTQYIFVGDRLYFRGDSYFTATGTVEIERDSLFAFADSAEYTGEDGRLLLEGSARVQGSSYDLVGRTITLASATDGTDEVRALREALLTGENLRVMAPQIVLHLADGELQRMVAVPLPLPAAPTPVGGGGTGGGAPAAGAGQADGRVQGGAPAATAAADASGPQPRPYAVAEDIELTGDSLDLTAPGGVMERIFAAGSARSVSGGREELNVPSLPELARQDWIEAETIEVLLVPVESDSVQADGVSSGDDYQVDRVIARVRARSLYRLVPADSTAVVGADPPAIHYTVADTITIHMADGQAERVESVGQVEGLHLEPLERALADSLTAPAAADSAAAAQPDSSALQPHAEPAPADAPRAPGGDAGPPRTYLFPMPSTPRTRLP